MALDLNQLEELLVGNLRSYLADYKSSDELEAHLLRDLCSSLNWFFGALVRDHKNWNHFHWVDGVIALCVEVKSANQIALNGYIFVGHEKQARAFMMEPFSASLRIGETGNHLRAYRITCGDANRPFATVPYSVSRRATANMAPEAWRFKFDSVKN